MNRGGERLRSIGDVLDAKLLRHAAPFDLLRMQTIEGRRQNLITRRTRATDRRPAASVMKFVIGHVLVERSDHPVTPRPDESIAIDLVAVRVAVARHIEPVGRHAFAELGSNEQSIQQPIVSVWRLIAPETRRSLPASEASPIRSKVRDESAFPGRPAGLA